MTLITDMKKVEQLIHGLLLYTYQVEPNSFATPWTVACQAPLSMGFPRKEYWSVLPFPSPGDPPDPRIEPVSPYLLHRETDSLLPSYHESPKYYTHTAIKM